MKFSRNLITILIISFLFFGCSKNNPFKREYNYDFNQGLHGWDILFSDYPVGEESNYELVFEHTNLPAPLDNTLKSIKVSGNNHSDDLLSMLYRKIDGLEPHTTYSIALNIDLASKACRSCPGAGGSPDLCLGAGAVSFPPQNQISTGSIPYYRPNFSSAIQSCQSNSSLKVLGTVGVGEGTTNPYTLINRNNYQNPIEVATNSNGELWLLMGTDSGYEGITTLYYKQLTVLVKK